MALFVGVGVLTAPSDGSGGPSPDDRTPEIVNLDPPRADEPRPVRGVQVTGYRSGGRELSIYYRIAVGDCTGEVRGAEVRETDRAVTVVLRAFRDSSKMCSGAPFAGSVEVSLDSPLGARLVRDGSRRGALVPLERPFNSAAGDASP